MSPRAQQLLVLAFVLLLRVPFLNQAIQGDDVYYLKGAEHAQIDPLHPTHVQYAFEGQQVDMRGHPHPPLNVWTLGALLAVFGDVREVPFHAAYIAFSLIAAFSMLSLARRLCARPLLATALFLVTPAFVINGASLEADLPFLAFWMAAIALFVAGRPAWSAVMSIFAALCAYQAVMLTPVLAGWLILRRDRRKAAWLATLAAPAVLVVWQIYERASSGALPAAVLAGYMQSYNLQTFALKVKNAVALTVHLGWLVFPLLAMAAFRRAPLWMYAASGAAMIGAAFYDANPLFWAFFGVGVWVAAACLVRLRRSDVNTRFLAWWTLIFFAGALVIFFAGAARYLLPVVAPVAMLAAGAASRRWIYAGIGAGAALSLALALVNYQHWAGCRGFARSLAPEIARHRTWTNTEWGLRFYLESEGALPALRTTQFQPGDLLITDAYAGSLGAGPRTVVADRVIMPAIPLRIVAPGAKSGYSSTIFGLRPFDVSLRPVDRVRAELLVERKPQLSRLKIGSPEAAPQLLSGIYNNDRWMSGRGAVLLKRPNGARSIAAVIYVSPQARARQVRLYLDGRLLTTQDLPGVGQFRVEAPAPPGPEAATVALEVDATFHAESDQRELGVVLLEVGFE